VEPGAVFSARTRYRWKKHGGAGFPRWRAISGEFDGDVLPWEFSRVPVRWGLYFERFLDEQRGDCPDIDIDICGARRDELARLRLRTLGRGTRRGGSARASRCNDRKFHHHARAAGGARSGKSVRPCHRVKWTASQSGCRTARCAKSCRPFAICRNAAISP